MALKVTKAGACHASVCVHAHACIRFYKKEKTNLKEIRRIGPIIKCNA